MRNGEVTPLRAEFDENPDKFEAKYRAKLSTAYPSMVLGLVVRTRVTVYIC